MILHEHTWRSDTTSHTLCCIHPWPGIKMELILRVVDWETLSSTDFQPLESAIQSCSFQKSRQAPPGKQIQELLALHVRLGGLGLRNPITMAKEQHNASKLICAQLVD